MSLYVLLWSEQAWRKCCMLVTGQWFVYFQNITKCQGSTKTISSNLLSTARDSTSIFCSTSLHSKYVSESMINLPIYLPFIRNWICFFLLHKRLWENIYLYKCVLWFLSHFKTLCYSLLDKPQTLQKATFYNQVFKGHLIRPHLVSSQFVTP